MVTVYYEALCPDSKNFIIRQLQPAFRKAPTLIEFQLVPYGKATVSQSLLPLENQFTFCHTIS